ncbi:MAG: hypothetical protein M0Z95_29475 [Actinomycetota bacterium]|nr:hypothetical protein [Actinomycetota bacterium]
MALFGALGALPAAVVGSRPAVLFIAPLIGAVLTALAAIAEFALGGSLVPWTVALGTLVSGIGAAMLWRRHVGQPTSPTWSARWSARWSAGSAAGWGLSVIVRPGGAGRAGGAAGWAWQPAWPRQWSSGRSSCSPTG